MKRADELKVGDYVFMSHWHGGGPVISTRPSGHNTLRIEFDAPVVNPPGVVYVSPGTMIECVVA